MIKKVSLLISIAFVAAGSTIYVDAFSSNHGNFVNNKLYSSSSYTFRVKGKNDRRYQQSMLMFTDSNQNINVAKDQAPITTENKYSYSQLGNLVVPNVGIGTISWSSDSLTTLENLELQSVVNESLDSRAAFFDTAERYGSHLKTSVGLGYGETERMLQKLIQRKRSSMRDITGTNQESPIIATKFTPSPWRNSVDSVIDACEESRKRLGVDQIDLYQLHMPDVVQPLRFLGLDKSKDDIYWKGLAKCYQLGLVKNVGVSNYGPTLIEKCLDTLGKYDVPLASNQIAYSLIGRRNGAQDSLDMCTEEGIKVLAYYPFAMGLLTGKYSGSIESISNQLIMSLSTSKKSNLELKDLKGYASKMTSLLNEMESIAIDKDKTIAQIALNYIICKGAIPIPGARSAEQVKDNIGALGWRLDDAEVYRLEHEADKLGSFEGAGFKRTSEKFVGYGVEKWVLD